METITTATLRDEADEACARGDWPTALRRYGEILLLEPQDDRARTRIGLALAGMGRKADAVRVLRAAAEMNGRRGFLLSALASLKDAMSVASEDPSLATMVGEIHGRALALDAAAERPRIPPPSLPKAMSSEASLIELVGDLEALTRRVTELATALPPSGPLPSSAVPLFADVSKEACVALVQKMSHRKVGAEVDIVKQGDPGGSLFVLVTGEVSIKRSQGGKEVFLARLGGGSLFGEMALITAQPRGATVTTVQPAELFEISREHVEAVAAQHPAFTEELVQFARRRMLRNLIATSPIFRPLPPPERMQILKSFASKIVPAGEVVIAEGAEPKGLYVVANGEVQITKSDHAEGDSDVILGHLREGDVFGEIALIENSLTTATAVATMRSVLLFLDKARFAGFADRYPEIREYLSSLSVGRRREIDEAMMAPREATMDADELIMV
jgi:CRP-like cAMP-binding protein